MSSFLGVSKQHYVAFLIFPWMLKALPISYPPPPHTHSRFKYRFNITYKLRNQLCCHVLLRANFDVLDLLGARRKPLINLCSTRNLAEGVISGAVPLVSSACQ